MFEVLKSSNLESIGSSHTQVSIGTKQATKVQTKSDLESVLLWAGMFVNFAAKGNVFIEGATAHVNKYSR